LIQGPSWSTADDVSRALAEQGYVAGNDLATVVYLSAAMGLPLLVEGEPGVGKTELAKAVAAARGARLVRLQCFEGIDAHSALYDWDYARQLLHLRSGQDSDIELYDRRFLIRRPLLDALESPGDVVLLIDEIDRADDEFEAFLLELLSDFQITIPELGTIQAVRRPLVILTSNRTRELHDALKRRCLYHWIDYPDFERELEIVHNRLPGVSQAIASRVCRAVKKLRGQELYKAPGVGETIAWAQALTSLGSSNIEDALGAVLKVREDIDRVRGSGVLESV
jgi:MoxR-like ATPase